MASRTYVLRAKGTVPIVFIRHAYSNVGPLPSFLSGSEWGGEREVKLSRSGAALEVLTAPVTLTGVGNSVNGPVKTGPPVCWPVVIAPGRSRPHVSINRPAENRRAACTALGRDRYGILEQTVPSAQR